MRPILISGFRGMSNIPHHPRRLLTDEGLGLPRLILNAHVTQDATVVKREGYRKLITLAGAHSLWAGNGVTLCVAGTGLYRIDSADATKVGDIAGTRMRYVQVNNEVYMSNDVWTGVYSISSGSVRNWGENPPPRPNITLIAGDLPPGTYHLCYTYYKNGQLSGAGPSLVITFGGGGRGIQFNNFPADGFAWITEPNTKNYFLAPQTPILYPTFGMPLPTEDVFPPPPMSSIVGAYGRIWGTYGTKVIYSEPFEYEWFKQTKQQEFLGFDLGSEALDIIAGQTRMYVTTETETWLLRGSDPGKMEVKKVARGSFPGTPFYGLIMQEAGSATVPMWVGDDGLSIALNGDQPVNISANRVRQMRGQSWAGIAIRQDGLPRIIVTLAREDRDEVTDIIETQRLVVDEPYAVVGSGGLIVS